jgi:predicted transcriptional regulator
MAPGASRETAPRRQASLSLSRELCRRIDEAARASGRTRSAEVEARLRASYDAPAGGGLLLLRLDEGLEDWLQAVAAGWIFGDVEQSAIFMLRDALSGRMKSDAFFAAVVPRLSPDRREHLMQTPKWQALAKGK